MYFYWKYMHRKIEGKKHIALIKAQIKCNSFIIKGLSKPMFTMPITYSRATDSLCNDIRKKIFAHCLSTRKRDVLKRCLAFLRISLFTVYVCSVRQLSSVYT